MICKQCSKKISGYDKRQIYCSKKCYSTAFTKIRKPKNCKQCGNFFEVTSKNYRNVFCCEDCFHKFNTRSKIEKSCPECQSIFFIRPSEKDRKHCSKNCMYKKVSRFNSENTLYEKPQDNPHYTTGITCYREFAFDHYPHHCNRCKKMNCKFEVHHIDKNRHNNAVNNLEILCLSCHKKHHKSKLSVHPE